MPSISELLNRAREVLPSGRYDNPYLDSLLLMCLALGMSKEQLYARTTDTPQESEVRTFEQLIERRRSGEPVAYILQEREFYGLKFYVDASVLIPRPDTETLVEWVLKENSIENSNKDPLRVHDCCTGSGAIAIALAKNRPDWFISASDISRDAAKVFEHNWQKLITDSMNQSSLQKDDQEIIQAPWHYSDLLSAIDADSQNIITANPPYLSRQESEEMYSRGWSEPRIALEGGMNGTELIEKLILQARKALKSGGKLYIESSDSQVDTVIDLMKSAGYTDCGFRRDLAGLKRVSRGTLA